MEKKLVIIFLALVSFAIPSFGQDDPSDAADALADTSYWNNNLVLSINANALGFSQYFANGGVPTISLNGQLVGSFDFKKGPFIWDNDVDLLYGTVRQGSAGDFRKNADLILLQSNFGYEFTKHWYITVLAQFRSQFAEGYAFADDGFTINDTTSNWLAPAYVNIGPGIEYKPNDVFFAIFSPANVKFTIVNVPEYRKFYVPADDTLNSVRTELGANLRLNYKNEVAKGLTINSNLNLFTNYLENFGLIDVNWEFLIAYKLKSWLALSFFSNLVYDDDVRFVIRGDGPADPAVPDGPREIINGDAPRTQWQYTASLGLTFTLIKGKGE